MKLYQHQIDGLEQSKNQNHVAYYWDMGLGKTFVGSEKMMQLGAKINLVVCQKSKVDDWVNHFKQNYNWHVFNLTEKKQWDYLLNDCPYLLEEPAVFVINYDLLWRRPKLFVLNGTGFTLLLDESSLIQNDTAKRSKFILKMNPKNVILLSGTPTGGKYERLWSQMHLLGWGISKQLYWKQYVNVEYLDTVGRSVPIVTGYKNVERLKRKMQEYGCQFLKTDEVFDLPDQNFIKVNVPVSKEYRKFRKDKIVQVENETLVGDTTLTRMLYERMLCGVFSKEKLKAFTDLLESTEDRLVVFYNFTEELNAMKPIAEELEKPVSIVNGKTKDLTNYAACGNSITFIQYQSGSMGLNLQQANRIIYFTLPLSSEMYEQSKKRIHRIGQTNPCFYYQLICKGSVEEKILRTLSMRKDYTEKLFEKDD